MTLTPSEKARMNAAIAKFDRTAFASEAWFERKRDKNG